MPQSNLQFEGLAAALLVAAEEELALNGIERLSMRAVAKRAGVSHGAPAHHFKDAKGLLTALAAIGYDRLLSFQTRREDQRGLTPREKIVASGLGYIEFAEAHPELFHLMFNSSTPDRSEAQFSKISLMVFERLAQNTEAFNGQNPFTDPESMKDLMASWAVVHGLAELVISGRAERTLGLSHLPPQERENVLRAILLRVNSATADEP